MSTDYDGLDLLDVLCICPILAAAGVDDDDAIVRICSEHVREVVSHPDFNGGQR